MALDSEAGRQALLGRLGKEPFGRLAAELGATERELVDYLLSLSEEGEPDDQPWWAEALARLERGVPIRDVAWIFRQPSSSIRRAIERAGLGTARIGADEIAVPRAEAPPSSSARPVIELPAIDPTLETLPDPAWSTWAPIESLVEPAQGARPVADVPLPRDENVPPDADAPIEDPAESFGWHTVPGPDADPAARRARSGNVRFVRPNDERAPNPPPAAPVPMRERKRRKVAASPVRMRSPEEVDLSELLSSPRRPSPTSAARPGRTVRPSHERRRFAWEIQLGSGRTVVVAADDAVAALTRVADFASAAELVGATLRRVPLAG
jgi:hypothetical protein